MTSLDAAIKFEGNSFDDRNSFAEVNFNLI